MKYHRDLRIKLQERAKRIYLAPYGTYHNEVRYFIDFIQKAPALRAVVETVAASLPAFDAQAWYEKVSEEAGRSPFAWPDAEEQRAKVLWYLVQTFQEPDAAEGFCTPFSNHNSVVEVLREATERVIHPFRDYLQDRLGDESEVLYLLERYKRRVEWFEQEPLFERYKTDTKRGEALYDRDLRRFLFEQGIDFPFSQPRSPSGEVDIVANLDESDPLVCEIKLFDAGAYGVPYIAKGFKQAVRYARDYHKPFGHLVVFNLSEENLVITGNSDRRDWPPTFHLGDQTIYVVVVQARPLRSASTPGTLKQRAVGLDDLTSELPAEGTEPKDSTG